MLTFLSWRMLKIIFHLENRIGQTEYSMPIDLVQEGSIYLGYE